MSLDIPMTMRGYCGLLVTLFVFTSAASALDIEEAIELREQAALEDVDEFLDDVVEALQEFAEDQGLDPQELPARIGGYSMQVLLHTWHGEDELADWLEDLVPSQRSNDGEDIFENIVLRVIDDVEFDDILVSYLYLAKIMKLSSIGDVLGQVEDLKTTVDVRTDLKQEPAYLDDSWFTNVQNQVREGKGVFQVASTAIYRLYSRLSRNISLQVLLYTVFQIFYVVLARISLANPLTVK
ncbi:uncharacterized protein [Anabrus simplex]|uniref:uncharacterized protein n=1 Tax=Anabrus simplex TaxID=316456 RepID=UPI0034DD25FC